MSLSPLLYEVFDIFLRDFERVNVAAKLYLSEKLNEVYL